ncbi:MAG TPA: amidohydrolase family protein [Sphingobium sp.]|uniref:amidohydrolase family protein n=1 Tax=Sphingobium sp. TaxID=1912891 RepID=UPI002ECFD047
MRAALSLLISMAACSALAAATPERFLLLDTDGGQSGELSVSDNGPGIDIVWDAKNNGRGTETSEHLELDAAGLPQSWRIDKKSDLGGGATGGAGRDVTVFQRLPGKVQLSVNGVVTERSWAGTGLLVPADASPWALGIYARVLLRQPGGSLPAFPEGTISLKKLREETIAGTVLSVFAINGPGPTSQVIRLDSSGHLVAVGDGSLVRADRSDIALALRTAANSREAAAYSDLQKKLLHRFDGPVRVRNVRIFDPVTATLRPAVSVVFFNGRITAIEPLSRGDEPGETVFDGEGGTLVPGLNDTHYHSSLAGPEGAWLSLAAGVTTARDMGSNNDFMQRYLKDVAAGTMPGPRIVPSGLIEGASASSLKSTGYLVSDEAAALSAVRWYAEHGYWQIKLYNSVNPQWVPAIAKEAHSLGLRVAGHIPAFTTPDAMIDAGYDELVHANQLMLGWVLKPGEDTRTPLRLTAMSRFADLDLESAPVQNTLRKMQANSIAFEPTLAIMRRLVTNRTGKVEPADQWWFDHMPKPFSPGHYVTVMPGFTIMPIKTAKDDADYNAAAAKMIELVRMMNKRGIRIFPGSDDNNGFVIRRELELFVEAGMTPGEALRRATLDVATYLGGGSEWGSIERGRSADFFLIPGDPTADIKALHTVKMTVAQGRVYFPSEIYSALGIQPFTLPPKMSSMSGKPRYAN